MSFLILPSRPAPDVQSRNICSRVQPYCLASRFCIISLIRSSSSCFNPGSNSRQRRKSLSASAVLPLSINAIPQVTRSTTHDRQPNWSPDSSRILFQTSALQFSPGLGELPKFYVGTPDGTCPRQDLAEPQTTVVKSTDWHPDSQRLTV